MWHDVYISRRSRDVTFSVDRVVIPAKIRGDFSKLNLKREVSMILYDDIVMMFSF